MNVSNKTLSVLLLAAIVVSLGGTFISLNKLGSLPTTGYTTENVSTGDIMLIIDETLSITTTDNSVINFGTCNLANNSEGITINSETQYGVDDPVGGCPTYDSISPTPIAVRNNGNLDANVTIRVNDTGTNETGTFLDTGTSNSSIRYKLINDGVTYDGGCDGALGNNTNNEDMTSYKVFDDTTDVNACSNLLSHTSTNSFSAHFEIVIPDGASEGDQVTVTFTAEQVIS